MAILKTEAIILKGWKLGETSKILSLYTREQGKVKVVAKGGRSLKSKFKGCLEPLSHLRIVYYDKRTRDLQLLSHADMINPHQHLIGNVQRTSLALAAAELVDKAVAGEESFPELFNLLRSALGMFDQADRFLEGVFWYFQSHFIMLMGYKPTWDLCMSCQTSLSVDGGYFQAQNGGLLCSRCGSVRGGLFIHGETLEILFWLQQANIHESVALNPSPNEIAEIRKMFEFYFKTHIEHLRSLKALQIYYQFTGKEGYLI